ncbi:MAG TPA: histidine phosphatase family protein [Acidimicrobiales bacterium]
MGAPPPATLVFLVRHGTTPTTGALLPGRAPGLHLSDKGKAQAESVGERLRGWAQANPERGNPERGNPERANPERANPEQANPEQANPEQDGKRTTRRKKAPGPSRPSIGGIYASPLERTKETAAAIAAALGSRVRMDRGLLECDFGEWTGGSLKDLSKLPEWSTVQRYPSGFRFPGGESFAEMQTRIVGALHGICERHPGEAVIAVSHADPIKAVVADAMGTHLDLFQRIVISPCSITVISYGSLGPTVLAVNSTGSIGDLVPS